MPDARIDWYRSPLEPGLLKQLTERRDLPGLLQAGSFLLVLACTTALALWFYLQRLWIPMVLACYLHSFFFFFVSMAAAVHELSHGTAFRTKWLNEFFYKLFCFLTWNNPVHFRASHTYHHQYTVHRGVDLEVQQGPVRDKLNFREQLFWFTFDWPWFSRLVGTDLRNAFGDPDADLFFWKPLFAKDDPRRKQLARWARVIVLGHLALALVFAWFQLWVLIYLVTFGSFFATWGGKFCGVLQHTGLDESVPDWRLSCHTFLAGPIIRWLYWNMNYHVAHHMYAAVPFWQLPRLHKATVADFPVPLPGFWRGMAEMYRIRKRQAENPSYIYLPEFPPTAAPPRRGKAAT